jgi:5'-3' exonuclease
MRALVDADVYAYQCGFAAQKTVDGVVVAEPVEHALALAKTALQAVYEELNAWLRQSGESLDCLRLYLTGKDNFREKIATIREYKGQRKLKPKPVHYKALREYMIQHWGATVVDGYEADDALAMEAHSLEYDPDRVCIISVDKDLKTVPGLLYSPKRKEAFLLSQKEALLYFYRQMITGDSSDNIVGVYKAGRRPLKRLRRTWKSTTCGLPASVSLKKVLISRGALTATPLQQP